MLDRHGDFFYTRRGLSFEWFGELPLGPGYPFSPGPRRAGPSWVFDRTYKGAEVLSFVFSGRRPRTEGLVPAGRPWADRTVIIIPRKARVGLSTIKLRDTRSSNRVGRYEKDLSLPPRVQV